MDDQDRLSRFEAMLRDVEEESRSIDERLDDLKAQNRIRTATFKQLMARKLTLRSILSAYDKYDLR